MASIPIIDLSAFTSGNSSESQKHVAIKLHEILKVNGCVGICGHGVDPDRLAEAFEMARKLFDLPYEDKMKAPHPDGPFPHRGYSGMGRERVAAKKQIETTDAQEKEEYAHIEDYKETYEIGSEEDKTQNNIWLPEDVLPGFRTFMSEFFWELNKAANAVMDALIMSLELTDKEAKSVKALHMGLDKQFRLAHYPPVAEKSTENTQGISRLGAHTDWSSFTLLFQSSQSGLEFLDRASNQYIPATPKEGVLYLNIGDMFQRISNGLYPSALHRVVANSNASHSRYSIPYFVSPLADGVVEPQPSTVQKDGKRGYEPVTFKEYSEEMFRRVNVYG